MGLLSLIKLRVQADCRSLLRNKKFVCLHLQIACEGKWLDIKLFALVQMSADITHLQKDKLLGYNP